MTTEIMLPFPPQGLRRFIAGTKRATVVSLKRARDLDAGRRVIGTVTGTAARLPLRVEKTVPLRGLRGLPAAAAEVGLTLADFTTLTDWGAYLRAAGRAVHGAGVLLVLAVDGPLTGTLPGVGERGFWGARVSPDSCHGRSWQRVDDTTALAAAAQIHLADQPELRTRLGTAIRAAHPSLDEVRLLAPVTDALLRSRMCGPHYLGKNHRARLDAQLEPALAWLACNSLITGEGAGRTWSRTLLRGLRIQHPRPRSTATA